MIYKLKHPERAQALFAPVQDTICLLYTSYANPCIGIRLLIFFLENFREGIAIITGYVITVSYTHLDVYKRQLLCTLDGIHGKVGIFTERIKILCILWIPGDACG